MKIKISGLGQIIRKTKTDDFYNCPFCDDDKGHLGVSRRKGIFHCFHCNASGKVEDLRPSLNEFNIKIKERLEQKEEIIENRIKLELPESFRKIISSYNLPYEYLSKREIISEEINKYNIGHCTKGLFAQRIIIPIYEHEELIYFVGRTYINANPRYMNSPTPKRGIIFKTFEGKVEEAIICEGIYDALRIGKVYPTISILGKVADKEQIKKISKLTNKARIMLDNDAYKEGFLLYNQLNVFISTKIIFINKKDPGEMNIEEIKCLSTY